MGKRSHPGKGIAIGNNCLNKTPFVPSSCSLLEWQATCFGDRCLLTGVWSMRSCVGFSRMLLAHSQLPHALGGILKCLRGRVFSVYSTAMRPPGLWGRTNYWSWCCPVGFKLITKVQTGTVTFPTSLSKTVSGTESESTAIHSFHGGLWASKPAVMAPHLISLTIYKPCQGMINSLKSSQSS